MNIAEIADGLRWDPSGLWCAETRDAISYPSDQSSFCFQLEDSSFWFRHRNRCIGELAERFLEPGAVLFDVGGGNGTVAATLTERGVDVWLVEPSRPAVENARSRGLRNLICGSFAGCRFREGVLPNVGLFDVVEHLPDDGAFLRDVARAIVDGGRLLVSVPAYPSLWSSYDVRIGHYRRYTRRSLTERIKAAGFDVEYVTYLFAPFVAGVFLFRALPDRIGLRRREPCRRARQELLPLGARFNRMLVALLRPEAVAVRRLRRVPFGTSCLAVARKRPRRS